MSEEINSSHLCTTEDAFEKFQANSMYEENEYITLSDIVPTQPQAPDIMNEICDIPYEGEVVLESSLEDQVCEVNSTIESVCEEKNISGPSSEYFISTGDVAEEVVLEEQNINDESGLNDVPEAGNKNHSEAGHSNVTEEGTCEEIVQPQPSRRGRKKKTVAAAPAAGNELNNDSNEIVQEHNNEDPSSTGRRKRGRPPKNARNRSSIALTPSKDNQNENKDQNSTTKRRGRPRKTISDQQVSEPTSSSDADFQDFNKNNGNVTNCEDYDSNTDTGKSVKRMRLLSSEKSESDLNGSILDQNITDTVQQKLNNKKRPGRRGRPKKKYSGEFNSTPKISSNTELQPELVKNENNDDDDADDICLSQLKTSSSEPFSNENISEKEEAKEPQINEFSMEIELSEEYAPSADLLSTSDKNNAINPEMNSSMPQMQDFEEDIDKIVSVKKEQAQNESIENYTDPNSLLVEDTTKRPTRRRAKKPLHYDEGSDEDPFANVELSDDEPIGCKKKYYSDDEYIPGKNKKGKQSESSDSDSDMDIDDTIEEEITENKRKRSLLKKTESSPIKGAKKGRKSLNEKAPEAVPSKNNSTAKVESEIDDDVEVCLKPSIIKTNDEKKNKEIESFLAKKIQGTDIQIKKKSIVQPFEIPVIDPKEQKKTVENSSQTNIVPTTSASVQTVTVYDIPMKENVELTSDQSEKACEFLNSIVKTTAELGELMTQKSQDFMIKKINTDHVTDTFKMDYCVRKSFLLFKLAKHNLMQMEEDLAKQYDNFLNTHNLEQYREQPKVVTAVPKAEGSDSDCEIIEAPAIEKPQKKKPAFNPKTVFLNKELSIKIAKKTPAKDVKPEAKNKINIKGRHTVWINDSVVVKKVKPTQSFLAQDSRNKKPPDYVTLEMVNSFFKQYYREKALTTCAPYVSPEWLTQKSSVCCYFFASADNLSVGTEMPSTSEQCIAVNGNSLESSDRLVEQNKPLVPKTLSSLCIQVLQNQLNTPDVEANDLLLSATPKLGHNPKSLYRLCVNMINISYLSQNGIDVNCASSLSSLDQEYVHNNDDVTSLTSSSCQETDQEEGDLLSASPILSQYVHEGAECTSPSISIDEEEFKNCASPLSLKTWCYKLIVKYMFTHDQQENPSHINNDNKYTFDLDDFNELQRLLLDEVMQKTNNDNGIKTLFSLCLDLINSRVSGENQVIDKRIEYKSKPTKEHIPKTLKCLTLNRVVDLLNVKRVFLIKQSMNLSKMVKSLSDLSFEIVRKSYLDTKESPQHEGLTINSINTLTEEAYHNIEHAELGENLDYYEDEEDETNFYDDDTESGLNNVEDDSGTVDENWMSQVQMQELRSCYTPNIPPESETNSQEPTDNLIEPLPLMSVVKSEPTEEYQENIDPSITVKNEPLSHNLDEMTVIPENIVTKTEFGDHPAPSRVPIQRHNSSSYDVDTFEAFVATNKMMHDLNELTNDDEEIFSQSALRVRRQFEPDDLSENDMGMSLLVPQTFEPLRIEHNAKDCLMESSSDESNSSKKLSEKKKTEKRSRGKPKKNESKANNTKGPVVTPTKEKPPATNEIAVLTRRMREKIRQEEKKVASSESDNESESIVTKKSKSKTKSSKNLNDDKDLTTETENTKPADDEIQCSNVDSTEQITEGRNSSPSVTNFNGFTAVDQNETSAYQKYVKYVYDQILPRVTEQNAGQIAPNCEKTDDQPIINPEDPVELLECEPSMPYFPDEPSPKRRPGPKTKTQNLNFKKALLNTENETKSKDGDQNNLDFVERHGWKCYPLNGSDTKLYQNAQIVLEKLPESFVQTYFTYQGIATKNNDDEEIDRLTNLGSLNRPAIAVKEGKSNKGKLRVKNLDKNSEEVGSDNNARAGSISPTFSENADELTPSEDEGGDIEDELPPPVKPTSDNNLAKNSLMDDNDSDAEGSLAKVKEEPGDDYDSSLKSRSRKGKSKTKVVEETPAGPVMLTADKMMNKELNLLHAPINLDDTVEPTPSKSRSSKNSKKSKSKTSPKENVKAEDDSSSEEEKHQWFTIKEKLLKRMVKKNDTTREDDAKRAKLVSEFIERRGESSESYINKRRGVRGRRISKKKMLERQKQLKVLSRELFGDAANDMSLHPKRSQQAYFKGRRNIRKVIDKKSLARSTVIANMEEFERKRRINIRQSRLREIMQCEEGVNVLVINDEVCLEYDFEEQRPVVTVHPFFTKVMKAHQYEGVKFMWDACFESLESIAAGQPGGGCILAHCMGLGKTLQVLALLHTVLTHPRVGMQRVLVCCPLSTVLNWVDEIHKWIGPVTNQIKVFELSKLKKTSNRAYQLEDWYNGGGIFIIGYELFRSLTTLDPFLDNVRPAVVKKIRTALLDPGPDIIICDEGHLLKNDCSVLAVAMSRVVTKRRIVLTGTPMQNNLREYYCMVNFVKPNLLGTYAEYSNRFENPIMNGQHRDSREEDTKLMKARTHILHKVLEGCLQRQEASVLYPYLPKKHEYTVFISLTKCQWDLYKHYLQNYSNTQNNKSVLKDFHILQKIWSHPQVLHNLRNSSGETNKNKVKEEKLEDDLAREDLNATEDIKPTNTEMWWLQYLEDGNMLDSLATSNKFVTVFRILEESVALNDKVLIFSTSLVTMDTLEYFLKKINNWSLGQEYYRLDGSVPPEVRQKWCREFNAENNHKTKLFVISTRAGCLGLNMTAANRVIILDTSWNPAHDIQSIFRVYRFGQKKDCYIYRLVALGTMEQKIYERSVTKQAVACRVVDEQQIDRHYNMAELTELYKYDETGAGVAGGVAVGVEDIVLLRVARDAALHAVHEHDSLLRGSLEQGLPEHERDAAWNQFQEEHAHKQEMQEIPAPVKIKKVKVKMPTQPPPLTDFAPPSLTPAVKSEPEESILPNDPEFTPEAPRPRSKGKKGRPFKSNIVSCCIPIQPEAPEAPVEDPGANEEEMIKKITHILLKYNYQNKQGPKEIAELVARVRSMVYSGKMDQLDNSDELTMSIARVLLGKGQSSSAPPLTDIAADLRPIIKQEAAESPPSPSPPPLAPPPAAPSRGRPRKVKQGRPRKSDTPNVQEKPKKGYVYEAVPSTSRLPEPDIEIDARRSRRRAALAAERNFEDPPVGDPVVELDDDLDDDRDDEFQPDIPVENEPYAPEAPQSDSSDEIVFSNVEVKKEKDAAPKSDRKPAKNARATERGKDKQKGVATPQASEQDQTSILLSDDEDTPPVPVRKKPGPARKTIKVERVEPFAASNDETVPLHPSLLSNKNFIKIVAHTYLSGNPMLDEDAATLAAQYSTFKALKEYEANGKNIDSGPIYDIAIKVLGVAVLKKLHQSNVKMVPSEILDQHPINAKENAPAKDTALKQVLNVQDKKATESTSGKKKTKTKNTDEPPAQKTQKSVHTIKVTSEVPPKLPQLAPKPQIAASAREPSTPDKKPMIKIRLPPGSLTPNAYSVPLAENSSTADVVPVGLFQRAPEVSGGETQSADECILPDDDDLRITSESAPAPPPALAPAPPAPVAPPARIGGPASRRGVHPVALTVTDPRQPYPTAVFPASAPAVFPASAPAQLPASSLAPRDFGTIDITSDEDDPAPAPAPAPPVPVSLTAIHPSVLPPHLQPAPPQPRVIRRIVAAPPRALNPALAAPLRPGQLPTTGQYILVPASSFAQMPPVVPVSLDRVQSLPPPAAPQPTDDIVFDPPDVPITADVGAEQTVETTDPPAEKATAKRVCKPGDILRITKSGTIEVLNRKDALPQQQLGPRTKLVPAPPPPPPPAPPVQTRTLRGTPRPSLTNLLQRHKAAAAASQAESKAAKPPAPTPPKPTRAPSPAEVARSPSPSDIFRNVVHIEADDYVSLVDSDAPAPEPAETASAAPASRTSQGQWATSISHTPKAPASAAKTPASTAKPSTSSASLLTPKPTLGSKTPNTNPSTSNAKPSTSNAKPSTSNAKPSTSNAKPSTSNTKPSTSNAKPSTSNARTPTPAQKSSSQTPAKTNAANKSKDTVLDLVDLTDLDYVPPASTGAKKTKSQPHTIVGTSKSIILCASGKAVSKPTPITKTTTPAKPAPKAEKVTPAPKAEPKKRPAPVENNSAKKKKTDKPMTLKDFDIDDIDDIIELD